ncbi:hypothetical protein BH09MYX1_BH09MYX1_13800 [soil metagenome]
MRSYRGGAEMLLGVLGLLGLLAASACGHAGHAGVRAVPRERPDLGAWSTCTTSVAVERENAAALAALDARRHAKDASWPYLYDVILVPGFTPLDAVTASGVIHPTAAARLDDAAAHLRGGGAPFILVSGANVHPDGTPYVEAMLMKRYLLDHGVAEASIFVEPCARHSHTNIRNAGRFMLRHGLTSALIVTSFDQSMYFANHNASSFDARCLADLGYRVGELRALPEHTVELHPSIDVFRKGNDPLDP